MIRAILISLCLSTSALAADIGTHENDSGTLNAISFDGEIYRGDLLALQRHISNLPQKNYTAIFLNSVGGNISEALDIGRFIRKTGIRTVVVKDGECSSACAFLFLGGYDAKKGEPWRTKSSISGLGFHAFWSQYEDVAYSKEDIQREVRATQIITMALIDYFDAVEADTTLLAQSLLYDADEMYYLSNSDALQHGINVWDDEAEQMIYAKNIMALGKSN